MKLNGGKRNVNIPVVGLCRFSYPFKAGTGFKSPVGDLLYSDDRLSKRLSIFENILIPSIIGQTEKDFTLGILVGSDLPGWCRNRIEMACGAVNQIKIITMEPFLPHVEACSDAIKSIRPECDNYVAEFRIDDDDGVAIDFVENVKKILSRVPCGMFGPVLELDFPKGYHMYVGSNIRFKETTLSHLTCAQAWLFLAQRSQTLFNYNHFKFWMRGPSLSIPSDIMYIRGVHGFNDAVSRRQLNDLDGFLYNSTIYDRFNVSEENVRNISLSCCDS